MKDSMIALPQFGPLSVPMALALLRESQESFLSKLQRPSLRLKLIEKLHLLEQRFLPIRDDVFSLLFPVVQKQRFSIKWFQETLQKEINAKEGQKKKYSISLETISNWRENGVVRPQTPRELDPDCAAAILTAAIIDERKQGFLPSSVAPNEPYWWCYAQAPPQEGQPSPIVPCPLPLPVTLEPGTLLWSKWPTFESTWKQFGHYGAMRFSSLDKESLARWDPHIKDPNMSLVLDERSFFGKMHQEVLQHFAEAIMYRLAADRLNPSNPFPDVPLVWPKHIL